MAKTKRRTATQQAADRLRAIVLDEPEGTLIGSEDSLVTRLECSRSTVRQTARLLEREGLLKVRRGINGGYFGTRPTAETIESTLGAHLEALNVDGHDTTTMATALWVVAVRSASNAEAAEIRAVVDRVTRKLKSLDENAGFGKVRELDLMIQNEIFSLARSPYIKLIFDVNVTFSRRHFGMPAENDSGPAHAAFVNAWREAKLMEMNAMASGNENLAGVAAQHSRKVWIDRIKQRHAVMASEAKASGAA